MKLPREESINNFKKIFNSNFKYIIGIFISSIPYLAYYLFDKIYEGDIWKQYQNGVSNINERNT